MSHNSIGPFPRRKRSVVSCRECQRRKQKCDRRQPCSHCMKRGKADVCLYDLDANRVPSTFIPVEVQDQTPNGVLPTPPEPTPASSSVVPDDFRSLGYGDNTKGTPGVLRGLGESASVLHQFSPRNRSDPSQYISIIRELPPRRHIDILVRDFFKNVAWHYDIVDEAILINQLSQWSRLTHDQLKQGPDALPANLRSFPTLLFQILAQALLFQPIQHEESLNDLKYAADMELSDRAADFSDAGHRLASSFGKSELTLTIVQAGLMRACFQKTTGAVIEAWHTLGNAIRDAQELGLHLIKPELTPYLRTENLADRELSRNVWHMLHLWDVHMATVLGRPASTRMSPKDVPLPMSARDSSGRQRPPQPRDVIWCGYHTAYKFLQDIHDLEKVEDWRIPVETIHETILTNIANLPAWATAQRLRQGEPPWLSAALEEMYTNVHFVLFALHRPFVFAETSSRHMAFHSAVQILESQARLFDLAEPLQYKAFSLVYATFDAMVLIAAMHIRFPDEFMEQFSATRRNLEWGLERLKSLQARKNDLAATALNIIQQLYRRMLTAVSTIQPQGPYHGFSDNGDLVAMEAETAPANWDTILQPDLGDLFVPQPLNELLCNGYFGQPLNISSTDPIGYGPSQFGSDITGSLGNDLMTDHSTGEASNMPSS